MSTEKSDSTRILYSRRGSDDRINVRRLLRCSHVFASVVHETLEVEVLREASALPLTVSQFHLLKLMCLSGAQSVGRAAEFMGVSAPAASKCIEKLVKLDLVVREPSAGDRRTTRVSVSERGRSIVEACEALKTDRLNLVLEEIQPDDVELLSRLLERFSVLLLRRSGDARRACFRCAAYIDADCALRTFLGGCFYPEVRKVCSDEEE